MSAAPPTATSVVREINDTVSSAPQPSQIADTISRSRSANPRSSQGARIDLSEISSIVADPRSAEAAEGSLLDAAAGLSRPGLKTPAALRASGYVRPAAPRGPPRAGGSAGASLGEEVPSALMEHPSYAPSLRQNSRAPPQASVEPDLVSAGPSMLLTGPYGPGPAPNSALVESSMIDSVVAKDQERMRGLSRQLQESLALLSRLEGDIQRVALSDERVDELVDRAFEPYLRLGAE